MLDSCSKIEPSFVVPPPAGGFAWCNAAGHAAPFVLFLPGGRIGGAAPNHLSRWRWAGDGALALMAASGAEALLQPVAGGFVGGGQQLRPSAPWPIRTLPGVREGRRNLVVLRSGDNSLHPLWLESMRGEERNWDLCLSYYGNNPEEWRHGANYFIPQKGSKFAGLTPLVESEAFLWGYDYIWFPDDDLLIDGADINRMFAIAHEFDLQLAQPSLAPGCFVNHRITQQLPDCRLHFTSFAEIMAPLFSREALAVVAPSFGFNQSGYGLDHLWPALLGAPKNRIAVIDEISMVHTRPMGANYDVEGASNEGWDVLERFGLTQLYASYGAIMREPQGWFRTRGGQGRPLAQQPR